MKTYNIFLADGREYTEIMFESYHSKYIASMYKFLALETESKLIRVESLYRNKKRRSFYRILNTKETIKIYYINSRKYKQNLSAGIIQSFFKSLEKVKAENS